MPISAVIIAIFSGLNSNKKPASSLIPTKESSQLVRVVPIFEPNIMPIACRNDIRPEFAKPTSITVTAVEDCSATVSPAPNIMLFIRFEVNRLNELSSFLLAIFSNPSDIRFIPNKKNAMPPSRVNTSKKSIIPPHERKLRQIHYTQVLLQMQYAILPYAIIQAAVRLLLA
jgi:hypothetical protein